MDGEAPLEPDSTTVERELVASIPQFSVHDDVLCQSAQGDQLYLGAVVQVNQNSKKCLVKFLDMTETWCKFKDMKLLNQPEEQVSCVVCKSAQHNAGNQVHVCSCGRGYHQRCHQPHIILRDTTWKCRICSPARPSSQQIQPHQTECMQCLKRDVWYRAGMLQCRRCRQWQHASCLATPKKIPLNGDRFYLMVCSGCNRGREICNRLALKWEDLVHLVLFNLNLLHHNKYHDLDSTIIPYLKNIWRELHLPIKLAKYEMKKLRQKLETVLQNCSKRFRSGRETKKRVALWGLRIRRPPRPPLLNLPKGPINEHLAGLKKFLVPDCEKPLQNGHVNSSRRDHETSSSNKVESSTKFHGQGLVKRSVPFPLAEASNTADARFRSNAVRRASRMLLLRRQRLRRSPMPGTTTPPRLSDSEDEALRTLNNTQSGSYKTDKKDKKETRKRPQRNLLEARLNSTENKLYNPKIVALPQPVEPSPKKKNNNNTTNSSSSNKKLLPEPAGKTEPFLKPKRRLVQKTILESLNNRPGNVEIDALSSSDERQPNRKPPGPQLLSVTRRLSARDLIVDEHGQVRRRRRIRRASAQPHAVAAAKLVPTVVPPPFWFCDMFSRTVNRDTVKDLLGPLARVKRGENYDVVARRVLGNGQVELLLNFHS